MDVDSFQIKPKIVASSFSVPKNTPKGYAEVWETTFSPTGNKKSSFRKLFSFRILFAEKPHGAERGMTAKVLHFDQMKVSEKRRTEPKMPKLGLLHNH